mmetsp:Transcript_24490/g.36013  ORF Transcript_24490/g.36013 Transcript_24490/m.36013 type:complete len:325 (+) Transcript_24490:45-1019(+)
MSRSQSAVGIIEKGLSFIGAVFCTKVTISSLLWLWKHFGPNCSLTSYGAGSSGYVLITGASDGIGRGIAEEAAYKGFNIILVARDTRKLSDVSCFIKEKTGVDVRTVSVDCSRDTHETYASIVRSCEGLDVSVVIHNVGVTNTLPLRFSDHSERLVNDIVTTNTLFAVKLTKYMLPILERRAEEEFETQNGKKKRAAIVFVSSLMSLLPSPFFPLYSSSKAFINQFVRSLRCELKTSHPRIDVTLFCPAQVCTRMSGISEPSFFVPSPRVYARRLWGFIGRGYGVVSSYTPHALLCLLAALMPERLLSVLCRSAFEPKAANVRV